VERGDRDPRPPIEIWGDEPAAESVEVVTTGPRTRRSRVRALAVGAGIVVLLIGGLVLGEDDRPASTEHGAPGDDEREAGTDGATTDRPDPTTRPDPTATTELIPGAPLLGEPSGLQVVITRNGGGFGGLGSRLIDLDTGVIRGLGPRVLAVTGRRLVVIDDGTVALWPAPYDGSGSTKIATIPAGLVVEGAWVVDGGRLVWLLQRPPGAGAPGYPATADLVDLDGRTLAHLDLRDDLWPFGAVDGGVVVSGTGGVYLIDHEGTAARISVGDVVSVAYNRVTAFTCDERLECGVEVLNGRGQRLDLHSTAVSNPGGPGSAVVAPDGRIASVGYDSHTGEANQIAVDGVPVFEALNVGSPAWSPDGRWLAVPTNDGVHLVDTHGEGAPVALEIGQTQNQYVLFLPGAR
jgi:hypothetical protein